MQQLGCADLCLFDAAMDGWGEGVQPVFYPIHIVSCFKVFLSTVEEDVAMFWKHVDFEFVEGFQLDS